jgi:hypothetical protein
MRKCIPGYHCIQRAGHQENLMPTSQDKLGKTPVSPSNHPMTMTDRQSHVTEAMPGLIDINVCTGA